MSPRFGLDFTGTCNPFSHNGHLDFTGIFLDSTGVKPANINRISSGYMSYPLNFSGTF
jgi:hypothetical protein